MRKSTALKPPGFLDFTHQVDTFHPFGRIFTGEPTTQHDLLLRVRYSETDQMGTFYNSRALEWFECGRTELLRSLGLAYAEMEQRGVLLPLVEAHVQYRGRARYDDLLRITASAAMAGKASIRFDVNIEQAESKAPVASGYTVHALVDPSGRPIRPPDWFLRPFEKCHICHDGKCIGACRD